MGTSTPKKDGFLPSLTSRNLNNSNSTSIPTTRSTASVAGAKNTAATTESNVEPTATSHANIVHNNNNNINSNINSNINNNINNNNNNNNSNSNSNTVYKKMTGNELSRWQQTWREILPKSFVYFEQDESNERDKKRAMIALKKLGATVEPFFCENVTIIVSRRSYNKSAQYPKGDIFRYAVKKQLKVWNVEKVFRFLNHLGEEMPDVEEYDPTAVITTTTATANAINNNILAPQMAINSNTHNNNLSNLLMNERIFGPSDRDPNVKRNDFKYFTELYLYIWDVTHKTRPVAIREWKDKSLYPKIHHTTNGKSLFVPESRSQNAISILRRHQRRLQCLTDTFSYRQSIIESAYDFKLPNHEIRHPSYEERVAFKRKWEETIYQLNPDENPKLKYKKLHDSLNDKDKKQFFDIFPTEEKVEVSLIDLSSSNKRRKGSTINKMSDPDLQGEVNINNNENVNIIEKKCKDNNDEPEIISSSKRSKYNTGAGAQEEKTFYNDNNEDESNGDGGKVDYEDNDVDINDDNYEDILKLVSDKVDVIDEINNPLINGTRPIDCPNLDKITKNELQEIAEQRSTQINHLKRLPKLMREDSIVNDRSQNVSADGKLLCDYGEIAASGIQASGVNPSGTCSHGNAIGGIGNGLGPSRSQVVNKTLANEHKRIVVLTPALNNRQKYGGILATINPETLKNTENIPQKEPHVALLIADDTIPETQEQMMAGYKDSSNKTTINEDELAALRSVEAANPFISEGSLKQPKNEAKKHVDENNSTQTCPKASKHVSKRDVENMASSKRQSKKNVTAAIGVFKEQKVERSKHEMKPGYCENCRVKYSDFSDHVLSEKHRSFAEDDSNFKQIDSLIDLLLIP
ncbi:hypothetical protein PMKS-003913 [Pichia membranifaciens]|uniref:DBF4-type domain-containing protein n=1 Tax=Pichia membranifaciens TaxID=4926 RepID=A0A1Q2YLH9_9ASCO|nr:hypothetical protein PMKS-003913 [Pichia membranifaciens]